MQDRKVRPLFNKGLDMKVDRIQAIIIFKELICCAITNQALEQIIPQIYF